jgi:hypothetical protein
MSQHAVVVTEIGKPVVLIEQPIQKPNADEVLVEVITAGSMWYIFYTQPIHANKTKSTLIMHIAETWGFSFVTLFRPPSSRMLRARSVLSAQE